MKDVSVLIKAMILVQTLAGSMSACSAAAHPACEDPHAVLCLQPWLPLSYHRITAIDSTASEVRAQKNQSSTTKHKAMQWYRYAASSLQRSLFCGVCGCLEPVVPDALHGAAQVF